MRHDAIAIFACLIAINLSSANAAESGFDPARIGWSEIQFHASMLFFSVDANVALNQLAVADVIDRLMEPGEGVAITPDDKVQELRFTTDFFGRHTTSDLLINSGTGATLQRTSHDSGKRFRHRIYRFTDIGAYQRTRWPVGKDEEKLPAERWEEWSETGEGLRAYPAAAVGSVVTDSGGLLYIVGAAQLNEPGDKIEILAYARSHVHRVQVEVTTPETIKVDYREHNGDNSVERKGKQQVMTLLIRGEGLDDGDDVDEFELLGLRGDIIMHMDPKTRAPLQLNGRVKIIGRVTLRITKLVVQ
jgi:hypothetical protein